MTGSEKFMLWVLAFYAANASAASSIREVCAQARNVSVVSSLADLQGAVCDIRERHSIDPMIQGLTGQVFASIQRIQNTPREKDWPADPELETRLARLGEGMNRIQPKAAPVVTSELGRALHDLQSRWGDPETRGKASNTAPYLADLERVLNMTRTGKAVLECYAAARGPLISGERVLPLTDAHRAQGAAMAFEVEEDPQQPGKYLKTLRFDAAQSPMATLEILAHEYQHGCAANKRASIQKIPPSDTAVRLRTMEVSIDEMRAYRTGVEMSKELTRAAPELACGDYRLGELFGRQVISSAEYAAKIDEMLADGTFPRFLLASYARAKVIEGSLVLDEHGHLLPITARAMESNGFRVAPSSVAP